MLEKGTMRTFKKVLGWIIGAIGVLLIISKENTVNFIANTGFFIDKFYFSILAIILLIGSYFLIKSGAQL